MSNITRETLGLHHEKLTVKLTKEDYYPQFEKSLKGYAKTANVPGFRKGMVPAGMLRKMHGQNVFQDAVLGAAGRKLEEYLKSEKVGILGQPMILPSESAQRLDMNAPQDVDFAFEIGLKPDFNIPAIDGTHALTRYNVEISDAIVDDEILRITRRYGKVENPATITHPDNILYATFAPADHAGVHTEGAVPIEETVLVEKLPQALQAQLMGKSAGDSLLVRPIDIATANELPVFMKDTLKNDVAAAEHYYELSITKVGLLVPRELDIMLYGEVFPNDNIMDETGFRAKLREELGREYNRAAENRMNDEIYETLVHTTPIQLPVAFLKRLMREGGEKPLSPAQVEREFGGFEHQLRWTLISDKLIGEQGISVSRDEVIGDIKGRVLGHFGMDADDEAPWMESYMQKMAKDQKAMNETYRQILYGKLFGWLRSKFRVEEKVVSDTEFMQLGSAHDTHHGH